MKQAGFIFKENCCCYEASCTAELSSRIELDLGYFSSTLYFLEEINETQASFTCQLRITF